MPTSGGQPGSSLDPAKWVDRHGDTLYRFTLSRLRDAEAAEEVVQETFVAALGARDQYSGKGSEGAWLLGICKRKVVDHVRRRNRPDAGAGGDLGPDPSEAMFDAKGNWRLDPRVLKGRPEVPWNARNSGRPSAAACNDCRSGRPTPSPSANSTI